MKYGKVQNLMDVTCLFASGGVTTNVLHAKEITDADVYAVVMDMAERAILTAYDEQELKAEVHGKGTFSIVVGTIICSEAISYQVGVSNIDGHNRVCVKSSREDVWYAIDRDADKLSEAENYYKHYKEAERNAPESGAELSVGQYVICTNQGSKESTLIDYLEWFSDASEWSKPCLCHIERIDDISEEELNNYNFLDDKPEGFDGGSSSEDVPDDFNGYDWSKLSYAQKRSFVQNVCVLRTPTRWVAVDPQGYSYCRYVHFPFYWREMFAADIKAAEDQKRKRDELMRAEEEKKLAEKAARYKERADEVLSATDNLKGIKPIDWNSRGAQTRCNNLVKKVLRSIFPGTEFSVEKLSYGYRGVEIEWSGDPDKRDVERVMNVLQGDCYDTGEIDWSDYGSRVYEYRDNDVTKVVGRISDVRLYKRTA